MSAAPTELTPEQALLEYKDQQSNERGFRFLKDPLFFTSSVFVKSPQRVEALALVMAVCLLVYSLAQRQLRQALEQAGQTIKTQVGKLTQRPTIAALHALASINCLFQNNPLESVAELQVNQYE